jgi:hypothetical protein
MELHSDRESVLLVGYPARLKLYIVLACLGGEEEGFTENSIVRTTERKNEPAAASNNALRRPANNISKRSSNKAITRLICKRNLV